MICWFRSTGSGGKETLCDHDFLGSGKDSGKGSGEGSGAKETLCHHDFLVPVEDPALKRSFAT